LLGQGLSDDIKTVLLFCKKEGSIMSKVGREEGVDTQAAVMASICYEYVDFGSEALSNNLM
jgi:hypothetical protein